MYEPEAFFGCLERLAAMVDCSRDGRNSPGGDIRRRLSTIKNVHELLSRLPEGRERFWNAFTTCMSSNPQSVRGIVTLMVFYLHIGPYSRCLIKQIDRQIEDLEQGRLVAPKSLRRLRLNRWQSTPSAEIRTSRMQVAIDRPRPAPADGPDTRQVFPND